MLPFLRVTKRALAEASFKVFDQGFKCERIFHYKRGLRQVMVLSIKNYVFVFFSIFLPLFFGLGLRGSLGGKLLITVGLLTMSLLSVTYAIKYPKRMWTGKYGVYASILLGVIGWGMFLFFWSVSTALTGWLYWIWLMAGALCCGVVVGFAAIVHDLFIAWSHPKK